MKPIRGLPHNPMSLEECRAMTEAAGRELLNVTDHMIHSRAPDGEVFMQWRPDPRFPASDAWACGYKFPQPITWNVFGMAA